MCPKNTYKSNKGSFATQCVPCPGNSGTAEQGSTLLSHCSCQAGWVQNFSSSSLECTNIDECALHIDNCAKVSTCTDSVGSFACTCSDGYTGDGVQCIGLCGDGRRFPEELCDDGNLVSEDGCDAQCHVETGFVCTGGNRSRRDTCVCDSGYYPEPGAPGTVEKSCRLSCSVSKCSHVGSCESVHGYCVCPRFYLGSLCEMSVVPPPARSRSQYITASQGGVVSLFEGGQVCARVC